MSELEPRIYAACLASYNAGRLHGAWIDANQDPEDLQQEIAEMLAESPEPGAEEWAIHDYEDFPGELATMLGEYPSLCTISLHGAQLVEHGGAWAAYAANVGIDYADPSGFEDSYRGEWDSEADYAQELFEDMHDIPDYLAGYIDWERVARDMSFEGTWFERSDDGGVWVFSS